MNDYLHRLYLSPAELVIAEMPTKVITVLGSCVSVTIHSPRLKIGAICHAVLPSGNNEEPSRFVDQSVRYMLDGLRNHGANPKELVAKLFGGSDMFELLNPAVREATIGAQNIRIARKCLEQAGVKLAASDTGGRQGRKLIFYSHTGEVYLKRIRKDQLSRQENRVTEALFENGEVERPKSL